MNWLRLALWAAVAAVVAAAGLAVRSHLIGQGEAIVQARWDAQKHVDLQASLALERQRNADQLIRFKNSERNADEQARRDALRALRDAATTAQLGSLRATIDRLNRRELPSPFDDAGIAALAREGATSRELLGRCAAQYRDVAAGADELRDQVIGLQADAIGVCRAPQQTPDQAANEN